MKLLRRDAKNLSVTLAAGCLVPVTHVCSSDTALKFGMNCLLAALETA